MNVPSVATLTVAVSVFFGGCATITNDPEVPVEFIPQGCKVLECKATNKRGLWEFSAPGRVSIRRSDDALHVECSDQEGEVFRTSVDSTMGGKIVLSAIFLDFGIVDSITDKHREYPAQVLIHCAK